MDITLNIRNKGTEAFVNNTLMFFRNELKLNNSKWKLDVYTKRGLSKTDDCRGMVTKVGPQDLVMILDSGLDLERFVVTMAHEMVHVKQFARGQLKDIKGRTQVRYWMGKKVNKTYFNQPWELEAFSKERILANKIFQILDI